MSTSADLPVRSASLPWPWMFLAAGGLATVSAFVGLSIRSFGRFRRRLARPGTRLDWDRHGSPDANRRARRLCEGSFVPRPGPDAGHDFSGRNHRPLQLWMFYAAVAGFDPFRAPPPNANTPMNIKVGPMAIAWLLVVPLTIVSLRGLWRQTNLPGSVETGLFLAFVFGIVLIAGKRRLAGGGRHAPLLPRRPCLRGRVRRLAGDGPDRNALCRPQHHGDASLPRHRDRDSGDEPGTVAGDPGLAPPRPSVSRVHVPQQRLSLLLPRAGSDDALLDEGLLRRRQGRRDRPAEVRGGLGQDAAGRRRGGGTSIPSRSNISGPCRSPRTSSTRIPIPSCIRSATRERSCPASSSRSVSSTR